MTLPKEEEVTIALLQGLPKLAEKHGSEKAMQILEDVGKIGAFVAQFDKDALCLAANFMISIMPPQLLKELKEGLQ